MPGTFVRIGVQRPRYSIGASGFMSYKSMCPGPPSSHIRMTAVSFAAGAMAAAAFARKSAGSEIDAMPDIANWTKFRRVRPSQYFGVGPASILSMAGLLAGHSGQDGCRIHQQPLIRSDFTVGESAESI